MSDDSRAKRSRPAYVIERIETVPMTAEEYGQAVVEWTMSRHKPDSMTSGHSDVD